MQLNRLLLIVFAVLSIAAQAQDSQPKREPIEIDFLSSYYEQEGNHSAVTGGSGSEALQNLAPAINVYIPIDTSNALNINVGVDFYSSASSDNINNPFLDKGHVSGASAQDARAYITIGKSEISKFKRSTFTYGGGLSSEFDVQSASVFAGYLKSSKDKNKTFEIKSSYYMDYWKLIYPIELRTGQSWLKTNIRHSVNTSLILSANLHKRIKMSINPDLVVQSGLLSTPFHRVYFNGAERALVEKLPDLRVKVPIGVRLNYAVATPLILKFYYRYYMDTWALSGHTFEVSPVVKIGYSLRLYPFYRYHWQSGVAYFAEHHVTPANFYTSDFDLSQLSSSKIGLGLKFAPLFGIGKIGRLKLKSTFLRYAYYQRSDGFKASIVTAGVSFKW